MQVIAFFVNGNGKNSVPPVEEAVNRSRGVAPSKGGDSA